MEPEEIIGSITFNLESVLKPWDIDPENYVIGIEGKVIVSKDDDDGDTELIASEIHLVNIKIAEVRIAGVATILPPISSTQQSSRLLSRHWMGFSSTRTSTRASLSADPATGRAVLA